MKKMEAKKETMKKILVMMTGGTICSSTNENGERFSDGANVKIIESFQKGTSPYKDSVEFDTLMPLDILSENMTIEAWNILLDSFRNEVEWDRYAGVIVLHGTDTLAYTASLLSICLTGISIPVCLVSSQLPLDIEGTNGHANFRAATELIMNGIAPNVYAIFRNANGVLYAHYGAHLKQCEAYSDDFFSKDGMVITDPGDARLNGKAFQSNECVLERFDDLIPCVLRVVPYTGIDYSVFNLSGIRAIIHETYHSQTVCVERKNGKGAYSKYSIHSLMDRCKQENVELILSPCSADAYQYESTGDILARGASGVIGMTSEMTYVKALVGCAMGLKGEQLVNFLNQSVNHEMVCSENHEAVYPEAA